MIDKGDSLLATQVWLSGAKMPLWQLHR